MAYSFKKNAVNEKLVINTDFEIENLLLNGLKKQKA